MSINLNNIEIMNKSPKGRRYKNDKLIKLKKPISFIKHSIISNHFLTDKNKIRFLTQIFRWYKKSNTHYKVEFFLKKKKYISDLDLINLSVKIQKAGLKKLLSKLGYCLKDYKTLKRRIYSLNFSFFFIDTRKIDINDRKKKNTELKNITVDITVNNFDILNIFITTNSYYFEEFYYIINTWQSYKKKEEDEYDLIFKKLEYIFSIQRSYKIIAYELYFPWHISKDAYYELLHRKRERKFKAFINEKKFDRIFPLKNVQGTFYVKDKNNLTSDIMWIILIKQNTFKKKQDLFNYFRFLIRECNIQYNIEPIPAYVYIENIDVNSITYTY